MIYKSKRILQIVVCKMRLLFFFCITISVKAKELLRSEKWKIDEISFPFEKTF